MDDDHVVYFFFTETALWHILKEYQMLIFPPIILLATIIKFLWEFVKWSGILSFTGLSQELQVFTTPRPGDNCHQ